MIQNEIKNAALEYAARGWHVFPAPKGEKKSHKSAEHSDGRKWGATTDSGEINRDWQQWPQANVGIVTGPKSGFFVIEADTEAGHGVDGIANLAEMIEAHGPLPDTIEALSPSGSWHVYFRWPEGYDIPNSQGQVAAGVDVRGDGGMVIGVPSVKPDAEKPYRWKNPPGLFDLAECPEWLLQLCLKPTQALSARAIAARNGLGGPEHLEIDLGDVPRTKKTDQDYARLLRGMKTDGEKHASVRDVAASLAAQGCTQSFVEGFIKENCPVYDRNVQASIDSAFQKFAKAQEPVSDANPVDLWGSFDPPELPQGLLPKIIEDFARANGDQMGADPAGLAVAALVTCAAAIPDAVQIKVKRHADWRESARLWAALIGPPSVKKSPIISAATGPLCHLDVKMMRAWQKRVAEYDALPPDEKKGRQRPPQTRLRVEDATVEATQQVLEGSPWGVLMLQDELSGFFGAMDKYNGGKGASADRAFWLRAFNGGQFALNRVGRGAAIIDNLSVCMLGGIQPEPIRKVAGDAVDDGLLQRLFPIMLRNATMGRDEPMPPVNSEYQFLIEGLRNLTPPGFCGIGELTFDDGAQAIRRELEAKHLDLQSMETINRKLASHIGKLDGLFARLCVVWHCVENVEVSMFCGTLDDVAGNLPEIVTEATARRVADFLHGFLLGHAIGFYSGVLGLSDDHDRLTAIAGYILTHKLEKITNRDVQRGDRSMRGLKDHEIRPLLEQLDALGWLERMEPPRPSSPPHWRVNPNVHAKFADRAAREAERRQVARATIQRLVQQ